MTNYPNLIYILAASHSGSTLTAMLLNAHPEICTAGELKLSQFSETDEYRCSCRELITDCNFWQDVGNAMATRGHNFDPLHARTGLESIDGAFARRLLRPLHRGPVLEAVRDIGLAFTPGWRDGLAQWGSRNRALVASVAQVAEARFVVDSSKTAVRLKFLRRIKGLNVKVLRLIRDGRAVALTYMDAARFADATNPSLRGGGSGRQVHAQLSMDAAALLWRRSNEEAEAALRGIPADQQLQVSYEDLCTDTDSVLRRVQSFLNLKYSDKYRQFREASHHVVGNGMRLDDSSTVRLDDRWKSELDADDLRVFDDCAGDLNRFYGYE